MPASASSASNCRLCAPDERLLREAHARQAVRISSRPVYVLRELVDLLRRERIVLPGYTILQNMVRGAAATAHVSAASTMIWSMMQPSIVDQRNGFMESFEHVLGRYSKAAPAKPAIVASLMAYATNIGLGRMADISNLSYQELSTAAGNFIRLETLKEANDRIANATAPLPIFRHFDLYSRLELSQIEDARSLASPGSVTT